MVKYFIDGRRRDEADGEITAETGAGRRRARWHSTNGSQARIEVDMGRPGVGPAATPVSVGRGQTGVVDITTKMNATIAIDGVDYDVSLVSMGNPHAVHFTETPAADFPLEEVGCRMERHEAFGDGVNFEIVNVTGRGRVEARVWERGVGETLACGSGACAIGVAGRLLGKLDQPVDVKLPGGVLRVDWDGANGVFLSGPAETVFTGEWP
jgi:diaminopimelate epimerase